MVLLFARPTPMEVQPAVQRCREMTAQDRLYLIQTVNALPSPQFNELVYALNPPQGIIPSGLAPQGERGKAFLDWVEGPTGCGLEEFEAVLNRIMSAASNTAEKFLAFAISGSVGNITRAELQAIVQLLRKKTGDDSIDIAFFGEGSIKMVLQGSEEGFAKLQELYESGELTEVLDDKPVEYIHLVDNNTSEARKAHLIEALHLHQENFKVGLDLELALVLLKDLENIRNLAVDIEYDLEAKLPNALSRVGELNIQISRTLYVFDELQSYLPEALSHALSTLSRSPIPSLRITEIRDRIRIIDQALFRVRRLCFELAQEMGIHDRILSADVVHAQLDLMRSALNLGHLDLGGANLQGLVLADVNLTGTNLANAIVDEAIFGDNLGLSETDKDDLRQRGAIVQDMPGSDVLSKVPVSR